jgi:hypothetical protein
MIVVWILINGLQDKALKNYEQNIIKDSLVNKNKVKDLSKSSTKK